MPGDVFVADPWKNLYLDTTAPAAPTLVFTGEHNGRIDSNLSQVLNITWLESDVKYFKVWGYKGNTSKTTTISEATSVVTLTDKPATLVNVTKNGVEVTSGTDYTYDSTTGEITFTNSLQENDTVTAVYSKDILSESDVEREEIANYASVHTTTKTVNFPEVSGRVQVFVRLWDDVENQLLNEASHTVYVDVTKPLVAISSIVGNNLNPPRISKITGKKTATIVWTASEDFIAHKVCVVADANAAHNAGTVIPMSSGSSSSNTFDLTEARTYEGSVGLTTTIDGVDLETAGAEGNNIIKIFVKDQSGYWSE